MKKNYYLMVHHESDEFFIYNEKEFKENTLLYIENHNGFYTHDVQQIINFGKFISNKLNYKFNQKYNQNV